MELNHYFVEHNIPERMDRLSRNDLLAETLYQDITNGMLWVYPLLANDGYG
jgi:hypothetical protein